MADLDVITTPVPPAVVLERHRRSDERGWFARVWCARELAAAGVDARIAQVNLSESRRAGTVRGLHMQTGDHAETKVVSVVRGAILDVAVDLREGSPTRTRHVAAELSAENGRALVVPLGFAHGFQALTDDVVILYLISEFYQPDAEVGFAHDDPAFDIRWPLPVTELSTKDAGHRHLSSTP